MSNLGAYQWFTKTAKKFGGVGKFLGVIGVGGYIVLRGIESGGKMVYKIIRKKDEKNVEIPFGDAPEYTIKKEGKSNENVEFLIGDKIRILGRDGDAVLVDKSGDSNSPYFVSAKLLSEISGYDE